MKLIQTIFLTILAAVAVGQNNNTFITGQFVPVEQVEDDSVFYLITLSQVYELHANKGYRNIFDVKWFDYNSFELKYDGSSNKIEKEYEEDEVLKSSLVYKNDSVFEFKINDKVKLLNKYHQNDIWYLMTEKDNELKESLKKVNLSHDESELEIGNDDSIINMLTRITANNQMYMDMMKLSDFEIDAVKCLFDDLKNFDFESFYNRGSSEFKKQIDLNSFKHYFDFIKNVYGKWECFSVLSQSVNTPFFGIPVQEEGILKLKFKVKFENYKEEVIVSVIFFAEKDVKEYDNVDESSYRLIEGPKTIKSFNISSNDYEASNHLAKISSRFFEHFNNGKYSEIYNESSEYLRNDISLEQVKKMLSLAKSMSEGSAYKLYKHNFRVEKNFGGLIIIHYEAENDKRFMYLSLVYTAEPGNYKLSGLHVQERKKAIINE